MKALGLSIAIALAASLAASLAAAQMAETSADKAGSPLWQPAGADAKHRVDLHKRQPSGGKNGGPVEQLKIAASNGSYVHFAQPMAPAAVVTELSGSVWVKADRAGVQPMFRVVLPRTQDPRTGKAVTTMVRGASYTQVGAWQQLQIDNLMTHVARNARALRTQIGPQVDSREAFVDQVVLNVYGGQGATNVWIEDPVLSGVIARPNEGVRTVAANETVGGGGNAVGQLGRPREVKLSGPVLLVEGRPFLPRIIQHQGEPLELLKGLGFNAVWLDAPPSAELLDEARRADLWIVCPPPSLEQIPTSDGGLAMREIPPAYEMVLAWDLGRGLSGRQLEATATLAKQLRMADARRARPLICGAEAELRAFSRHVDLLMASREPLGTSLELAEYGTWLRDRPRFARPGTPLWTTIQTQPAASLQSQLVAMGVGTGDVPLEEESVRLLVHTSLASGVHGLAFASNRRLDSSDTVTRLRALLLEQINLELDLAEPWAAGGNLVATATTSDSQLSAAVLQTERARLLLPLRGGKGAQQVPKLAATGSVSFIVPGVPESHYVYELTPGGLRPMLHRRVTGGMMVTLDEFSFSSRVVITSDPVVIDALTKRLNKIAPRAAQLQRELAARTLLYAEECSRLLPSSGRNAVPLASGKSLLEESDRRLAEGKHRESYVASRKSLEAIGQFKRLYWEQAAAAGSPVANPLGVSFATLGPLGSLNEQLRTARRTVNLLPGGDFESLEALTRTGWQHFQHPQPPLTTEVQLAATAPVAGRQSLLLRVAPPADSQVTLVETPPLWITTSPVQAEAGTWLCFKAKVRVTKPITGSADGLLVLDSIAGEALAERVGVTTGVKEITLYRVATATGPVTMTFALTGIGEATIDDVSIQAVERIPSAAREMPRPLPPIESARLR